MSQLNPYVIDESLLLSNTVENLTKVIHTLQTLSLCMKCLCTNFTIYTGCN